MGRSRTSLPFETDSQTAARCVPARTLWAVLAFAMILPTPLAWIYFVMLAKPVGALEKPSFLALIAYAVSKVVQFGFPLLWVFVFEERRLALWRPSWKGIAAG